MKNVNEMTLADAEAELSNRVYTAATFFERLEGAGKIIGNGHHAAQEIARLAVKELRERWTGEAKP